MKHYFILFAFAFVSVCTNAQENDNWRATFSSVVEHLRQVEGNIEDKSADSAIILPTPRFAYVNIKGTMSLPSNKSTKRNAWLELYDGKGHYFKKRIVITAQGNYTLRLEKKSYNFDLSDNDWDLTKQPDISFGNWVEQDGFLLKGFYTDALRGISEVGYKLFEEVVEDRRPFWEREGYEKDSEARCFPDGFPCAVYFNGDYLGLYSWQLKKSRKNMNMKKHSEKHIHLDGDIRDDFFFHGTILWDHFDVRNPKDIYTTNDILYDGNSPAELMGNDSPYLSQTESAEHMKDLIRTVKVKNSIIECAQIDSILRLLESNGASVQRLKQEFEKHFEIQSLLDYYVFNRMTMNLDGMLKNWQWFTYDGQKWMVAPYDLDMTFGVTLYGFPVPVERSRSYLDQGPYYWINKYYVEEEKARYAELREKGVFTTENIQSLIQDWYDRIGEDYYAMERNRWPESPCYNDLVVNPNWELYEDWEHFDNFTNNYQNFSYPDYLHYITYKPGDICLFQARLWKCKNTVFEVEPAIVNAGKDSLDRYLDWVDKRVDYMDKFYGYDPNAALDIHVPHTANTTTQTVYSISGVPVKRKASGIYITKSSDGTVRKEILK